jgi:IclR family transcriptional regulator, pca regulon regulatory protein
VRVQGWALVDQELEIGLRSIAAPIRDASAAVVAAVNLSVHAASMTPAQMRARLLPPLRETAVAISRELTLSDGATRPPGAARLPVGAEWDE